MPEKLSLGFARVDGPPEDFTGVNIRSASRRAEGGRARGKKASGMLMVDGVLYLWVRNAGNAQLAWSADHARTWTWCDWKFETSFGCPTFLNFGKDYAGARDDYVYIYSHDGDSAYGRPTAWSWPGCRRAGSRDRGAYEFFAGMSPEASPLWTDGHRRTRGGLRPSGGVLPLGDQLRRRPEALPLVPDLAGRRRPVPGRVRHLRRPGAVGAVDEVGSQLTPVPGRCITTIRPVPGPTNDPDIAGPASAITATANGMHLESPLGPRGRPTQAGVTAWK